MLQVIGYHYIIMIFSYRILHIYIIYIHTHIIMLFPQNHTHTHILRPCDYFSLVSRFPQCFVLQELVDAVWDEDRWGSNGIGAWGWILNHVFVWLLCVLCPILNLTLLFLIPNHVTEMLSPRKNFPFYHRGPWSNRIHHRGLDDFAGRSGLAKRLLDAMPATGQG